MQLSRLFNVLVVQSTLALGACDDDSSGETDGGTTEPTQDDETTGGTGSGASSAGSEVSGTTHEHDGMDGDDGVDDMDDMDDESSTGTSEDTSSGDDPVELECSDPPHPSDPCGCPCCWAMDCINTDEACCAGFTELCTAT